MSVVIASGVKGLAYVVKEIPDRPGFYTAFTESTRVAARQPLHHDALTLPEAMKIVGMHLEGTRQALRQMTEMLCATFEQPSHGAEAH